MSWLALFIGVGIAVGFLLMIFFILWLFPVDGKRPRSVRRSERTLCTYQVSCASELRGDVKEPESEETYKQVVTLRSCFKNKRQGQGPRSTVPGMMPSSDHVDGSHTVVLEIDGEEVHTNVQIKGEDSLSATLEFDGPDRSIPHRRNGNINDIGKAGSLHEFLVGLHKEFGSVASFWWGTHYTVSIASAELFKQHQHLFNRPEELFHMFEPFITRHSIQYANGADGKLRRQAYDKVFNCEGLGIYYDQIQKVANEITSKWNFAEMDDHFPLGEHMCLFAVKSVLITLMGDKFKDDKEVLAFKHNFDVIWEDLEQRLTNPILPKENSIRAQNFKQAHATLREIIARTVKEREMRGKESRVFLLIDAIIGHHPDDEERRFADAITYMTGGLYTTSNILSSDEGEPQTIRHGQIDAANYLLLTWCIYFLCMHVEAQEKLYQEVMDVLGPTDNVTPQSIGKLKYVRQVLDETLRCAMIAPWGARYADEDMLLGGHRIYAETPVIHAFGVSMMDETIWPAPTVFDPDRFSSKRCKGRPDIAFSPFGFAGHRQCPAYGFVYVEATILLVTAIQKFKFMLVPGQDVKPHYGLVTHPKEEIWFKVARRV